MEEVEDEKLLIKCGVNKGGQYKVNKGPGYPAL
jgi:hypothetical protein